MPAFIDLTGRVFGKWTVLHRDQVKGGPAAWWVCRCACGVEKTVHGQMLREGRSLGCRRCYEAGLRVYKPGDKVGKWTIKSDPLAGGYLCECECGTSRIVGTGGLRAGTNTQCKSCYGASMRLYQPGDKINKWTIVSGPRKGNKRYSCVCECGAVGLVPSHRLRTGRSRQCRSCAASETRRRTANAARTQQQR